MSGDTAGLIALVLFFLLSVAGGWKSYDTYKEVYASMEADPPDEEDGEKRKFEIELKDMHSLERLIYEQKRIYLKLSGEIFEINKEYRVARDDAERNRRDAGWADLQRKFSIAWIERIGTTRDAIISGKDRELEKINSNRSDTEDEMTAFRNRKEAEVNAANERTRAVAVRLKNMEEQMRVKTSELKTLLNQAKDELEQLTARDPERTDVISDGEVVRVELPQRLVIINMGRGQGVRPGWRFEAFQMRGNRRIHKAWLEVKDVQDETASCILLRKFMRYPRSPTTSYVGPQPEAKYDPYVTGGGVGNKVQSLGAKPKRVEIGVEIGDPIVPGDSVWNPFFSRGTKLRFAVKGSLWIRYKEEVIVAVIRRYDGIVDEQLTARTDFLVAGRWATEEIKRAREMGVPVFHEWELFRFLEP